MWTLPKLGVLRSAQIVIEATLLTLRIMRGNMLGEMSTNLHSLPNIIDLICMPVLDRRGASLRTQWSLGSQQLVVVTRRRRPQRGFLKQQTFI